MKATQFFFVSLLILGWCSVCPTWADDYVIPPLKKNHWAWRKPIRPELPRVRDSAWPTNAIDFFILAKLEAAGLEPAVTASRAQLLRRVTFDLIGLPPTPAEIDAFANDRSPNAWEKVIDRLLASPHYGERWGRHWLDLARYADSNGFEHDESRPDAWRYRDYVIRSFNQDKPYDRFVREQLAGDELFGDDADALIATGFNLLGPDMTDAASMVQRRHNTLNDMTDTAGLMFLGMTVGCARCHDHKFEPIPQKDYFRLQAFFTPAAFRRDLPIGSKEQRLAHDGAMKDYAALIQPIQAQLKRIEEPARQRLHGERMAKLSDEAKVAHATPEAQRTAKQMEIVDKTTRLLSISAAQLFAALSETDKSPHKQLQQELKKFDGKKPAPLPVTMGLRDPSAVAPKTFLLKRGELGQPGEAVDPGWPIILVPGHESRPATVERLAASTGRRSALADWIVGPDNPLTARVLVNRLWQHHFGRGIVATPSDFGVRGQLPTHPRLLDWLATEFVARGWSIKQMHKLMLLSATYQQDSKSSPAALTKDPDNKLLGRMNRLRLEGEAVRDSLLYLGGRLNTKMAGPGVFPPLAAGMKEPIKSWTVSADPRDHTRRSVYIFARRNLRFAFLEPFDLPDSNQSCPKRDRSTTAPQALALLNSAEVQGAAQSLALRIERAATSVDERIVLIYRNALGRAPSPRECDLAREFLQSSPLSELCRALFNVNEFVYLD